MSVATDMEQVTKLIGQTNGEMALVLASRRYLTRAALARWREHMAEATRLLNLLEKQL